MVLNCYVVQMMHTDFLSNFSVLHSVYSVLKLLLKVCGDNILHGNITSFLSSRLSVPQMVMEKKQISPQMLKAGQKISF